MSNADDPAEIAKRLPSEKEQRKVADEMQELYSATNRAGAKGIRSGVTVPAIRPRGLRSASEFVDKYTPGKYKSSGSKFKEEVKDERFKEQKKELPETVKIRLPRSFCADCGRTDRPHEKGRFNIHPFYKDEPALGISAGETLIDVWCEDCWNKAHNISRGYDPSGTFIDPTLQEVDLATGITKKEKYHMDRLDRMRKNRYEYVASRRTAGDMSIYDVNRNGW